MAAKCPSCCWFKQNAARRFGFAQHFRFGAELFCGGVGDDLGEAVGVEAGAADEGAVDVFEAAEAGGVVGFDGAAVEDADARRRARG